MTGRVRGALVLLAACQPSTPPEPSVTVEGFRQVVPGPGLPDDLRVQAANNNLSIARHEGRLFLAWRTAPSHFASEDAELLIVSTEDERSWRFEGRFALGRDLREPQLVSTDDGLWLYLAKLGTDVIAFEPGGTVRARYTGPGEWSEPEDFGPEGLIVWRLDRLADGRFHLFGYTGGEGEYSSTYTPISVHWWVSDDAVDWEPADGDDGVVLTGGGSETSAQLLDDGSLVAVVRSESGRPDGTGFGSYVCTAPADDLGTWTCDDDPRKYDSPLLLRAAGRVWLVGRRQVAYDGAFDLGLDRPWSTNHFDYLTKYSGTPKRCAVWTVDPATRAVDFVADLPSQGDTCFPDAVEDGEEAVILYNYSNDPALPELTWFEGQLAPTNVYRQRLVLE